MSKRKKTKSKQWTQTKRQALSRKMRTMTDEQELRAVRLITAKEGPTIMNLAKKSGVSYFVLVHALDCQIGIEARKKAVRARQSESMRNNKRGTGHRFPPSVAKNWKQSRRGSGNPNWRGGSRNKREKIISFRRLIKYKEFVEAILERDRYKCTHCKNNDQLIVHHVVDEKEAPELLLDENNAETLCRACHIKEHQKRGDIPHQRGHHCNQGEQHPLSKLTESDVYEIRKKAANKQATTTELSLEYGVHKATIRNIIKRKGWKSLPVKPKR